MELIIMTNGYSEDVIVVCHEDCGNAPKKLLLRDFNIAFAKNEKAFLIEQITDDAVWNIVGRQKVCGKDEFSKALNQMEQKKAIEIQFSNIITHGRTGAVNGTIRYNEGNYSFCDVYTFNSAGKKAKIKEITSYVIKLT